MAEEATTKEEFPKRPPNTADHCTATLVRVSVPVYASQTMLPPGFVLELEELLDKYDIIRRRIEIRNGL